MEKWVCDEHPWEEMGHNGCDGGGIVKDAGMFFMMIQIRNEKQKRKEFKAFYGSVICGLRERIIELENELNHQQPDGK